MWIELDDSLFYFGTGGVIKVEEDTFYDTLTQKKSEYGTSLYTSKGLIARVKETKEMIKSKLKGEL